MTRRRRRFLIVIGVLGMVALSVWALRDRPRALLARALGARLGATVTIQQLEIVASDHFRLHGVTVRDMASQPRLAHLTLDVVEAKGKPRAIASGHLSTLQVQSGVLVLQAPTEPAAPGSETLPHIDRLTVEDLQIQLPVPEPSRSEYSPLERIRVDGTLIGLGGGDLTGDAQIRVPALETTSLLELASTSSTFVTDAATTGAARLPGVSTLDVALRTKDGQPHVQIEAALPHAHAAHVEITRNADETWTVIDGRLDGLALGPWLAAVPMAMSPEVEGTVDVTLAGETDTGLQWRAALALDRGAWIPTSTGTDVAERVWRARDLTGSISGIVQKDGANDAWQSSFDGQLDGVLNPPEALVDRAHRSVPLHLSATGHGYRDPTLRITAAATVRADSWGTVTLDGTTEARQLAIEIEGRGLLVPWSALPAIRPLGLEAITGDWRLDGSIAGPWATARVDARLGVDNLDLRDNARRGLHAETVDVTFEAQPTDANPWGDVLPSRFEMEAQGVTMTEDDVPRLQAAEARLGSVRLERRADHIRARGQAQLRGLDLIEWPDLDVKGAQVDQATAVFDLDGPRHDVTTALDGLRVDTSTWRLAGKSTARISARGATNNTHVTVAPTPWTIAPTNEGPFTGPFALTVGGDAQLDLTSRETDQVRAEVNAEFDAGTLGQGLVTGTVGRPETDLRFEVPATDLVPWLDQAPALRALLPAGYAVSGTAAADLRLHATEDQPWSVTGDLALLGGGLASDDGSRVLQGLPVNATITLGPNSSEGSDSEGSNSEDGLTLNATARIGGFQMLWGAVFADYGAHAAVAEIDAYWHPSPVTSPVLSPAISSAVAAKPMPSDDWRTAIALRFDGAASAGAPTIDLTFAPRPEHGLGYTLRAASDDVASVLANDLLMPLQGSVPWLEALEVAGAAAVDLTGHWSDDARAARGRVRIERGLGAYADDRFRAEGLDLDLPVDLLWRRDAQPRLIGPPLQGRVRFVRLIAGGLAFEPVATTLDVVADRVQFAGGLNGPFLGGRLGLGDLALVNVLQPSRHISTAIELRALDLSLAASRLGLPPLEGRLDGAFPRVRANVERFEVEGDGAFDVFGGSVRVFDIAGSEIFSRYPRLTFSADFAEIDLEQVTRTFDVGVMTGHVEGRLRQCELFRGTPVRCTGHLASMPERHTKRYIDVKAVNNISILGTGGRIGRLDRGLHRFLRRFTYGALGVDIVLREDRFRLRGLLMRDQRELFLKGRLPFPIDIVNVEPGNTVSFQTMLGRLRNFQIGGKP